MNLTSDEIKWRDQLAQITQSAKEFGVCSFLQKVHSLGLSLNNYCGKLDGKTILHYVDGWCFEFKVGTGKFINRY